MTLRLLPLLAIWLLPLVVQASFSPDLVRIEPQGGQRGTEMEFLLHGQRLDHPAEILFHHPGIEVLELKAKTPKLVAARIRISPDATLGEHPFRLRTTGGVSFLRSIWVGQFPAVMEKEPNNHFDSPQAITMNSTVQGVSKSEDVDFYSVRLKKGELLSVEVEAMRLGRLFFDSFISILDPNGFELAASDDATLLYTDSFASIIAPEDGDYRVVMREAAYQGSDASRYRLHIGSFPRPSAVFPPGAKPGKTLEFRFIGDPSGERTRTITIPQDASGRYPVFAEYKGLLAPSPNWIEVSPLTSIVEEEPNESLKAATALPDIPCAAHGIIAKEKDIDWFQFKANKGQNLDFKISARSLRSPLDSVIVIHDSKGKGLANNDDQGGPDSFLKWTCPADGDYLVSVRDKLFESGPDFSYRLEITQRSPSISATFPVVERNRSQVRKVVTVPRGNRFAASVNISRSNLSAGAELEAGSLPSGISMRNPSIPKSLTSFPVVFEAASDAPIAGNYSTFTIRSTGDKTPSVSGPLREEIHHVEVNNQGPYHSTFSRNIAVAVVEEAPFSITLETPLTPIVQRGILKLKLRAERRKDFNEAITLRFLWKPPGIGSPATIKLEKGKSEIDYEINANEDAPNGDWEVCVLAEATTKQGPVLVSSSLTPLKVREPWLTASIDLSATEQGRSVPVVCHLEALKAFKGKAKAELMGLPHGTKTVPVEFTHDNKELTFPVEVAKDAAIGKHSGLFLRLHIPHGSESILHQTGHGGTLRVDKKPENQVTKDSKKKPVAPNKKTKPLSRLEQLRKAGR